MLNFLQKRILVYPPTGNWIFFFGITRVRESQEVYYEEISAEETING